jgi:cysteine-rich repeat protein
VTGYYYDATTGRCADICGDGIMISDLCDDGNTLNGDGCSSVCTIEPLWNCKNSSCQLLVTPNISVISVNSVSKNNQIIIILKLEPGLRLMTKNFILGFLKITKFTYTS